MVAPNQDKEDRPVTKSSTALDSITAKAWELARDTDDDRIRLQALTLIKETEKDKIDIVSNVNIVDQIVTQTEQRQQAPPVSSPNEESIEEPDTGFCSFEPKPEEEEEEIE